MSDTKNVKLGVCTVYYDGVDLGYTQGGVEVSVVTETHAVNVDQFGKSTVAEYIMKRDVKAKVPMAETTLDNLIKIMPGAEIIKDGSFTATITIATQPAAASTVTLAGTVFTFVAVSSKASEVAIGSTVSETAKNLVSAIEAESTTQSLFTTMVKAGVVTLDTAATFTLVSSAIAVVVVTVAAARATGKSCVVVSNGIGINLLSIAKELRLVPRGVVAGTEDFVIPLAATAGAMNFSYMVDKERVYSAEFNGYPDSVTGVLFKYGDTTVAQ